MDPLTPPLRRIVLEYLELDGAPSWTTPSLKREFRKIDRRGVVERTPRLTLSGIVMLARRPDGSYSLNAMSYRASRERSGIDELTHFIGPPRGRQHIQAIVGGRQLPNAEALRQAREFAALLVLKPPKEGHPLYHRAVSSMREIRKAFKDAYGLE